jgi:hypothetical protein
MRKHLLPLSVTIVLLAAMAIMWSGRVDTLAGEQASNSLESALVSYGLARTLNGVLSVAQGTEIALQPAGVGVVLTAGEILDPLNDLVERFSWLVLMASVSLGLQMLLTELFATPWANALVSVVLIVAAALVWRRHDARDLADHRVLRVALMFLLVRFAVVGAALASSAITHGFLAEREQGSIEFLSQTSSNIEATNNAAVEPLTTPSESMVDRFNEFLDDQRDALNMQAKLESLQRQVESAIGHVINLIVIYLVQTIVVPMGVLVLVWVVAKRLLRGGNS